MDFESSEKEYRDGNLVNAIEKAAGYLRSKPGDIEARVFLAELYCIAGDLERADRQLQTLLMIDPELVVTIGTWRQLIRSACHRNDVFLNKDVPTLISKSVGKIYRSMRYLHQIDKSVSENNNDDSVDPIEAVVNGTLVNVFMDIDEIFGMIMEFIGTNGKYFWIDQKDIKSLQFSKARRPLDLLWRRCEIALHNGSEGTVYMPSIYPFSSDAEVYKLGRATEWNNRQGFMIGGGLREFVAGNFALNIHELESVVFKGI